MNQNPTIPTLAEQIEALPRADFRRIVNPDRRATLAIGALILHWAQLDSQLGNFLHQLRVAIGIGNVLVHSKHPMHQRLDAMRGMLEQLNADPQSIADYDKARLAILAATAVRNDVAHGATGLGSHDGTPATLYVFCAPVDVPGEKEGRASVRIRSHRVDDIFDMADNLFAAHDTLARIVQSVTE